VVADYTGSTKTVTLTAGVTFTAAATDNIAIYPPVNSRWAGAALTTAQTGDSYAVVNNGTHGNAALKALIDAIDDYVDTEVAAIKAKTDNLPTDPADASDIAASHAALDAKLDIIDTVVDAILADTGTDGVVLSAATMAAIADALLNRDMSTGTDSGSASVRTVRQALRALRNKWSISGGTLTVTKEDDATTSWTASLTSDATADPITASDPAGP
jgi:hypothetical protein